MFAVKLDAVTETNLMLSPTISEALYFIATLSIIALPNVVETTRDGFDSSPLGDNASIAVALNVL